MFPTGKGFQNYCHNPVQAMVDVIMLANADYQSMISTLDDSKKLIAENPD